MGILRSRVSLDEAIPPLESRALTRRPPAYGLSPHFSHIFFFHFPYDRTGQMAEGKAGGGGAGLRTATGDKGFATKLLMQQYGGTLFIIVYTCALVVALV